MSSGGALRQLVKAGDASSKPGHTLLVPRLQGTAPDRVLLVGCGPEAEFDAKALARAVSAAAETLSKTGIKDATSYLSHGRVKGVDDYYAARLTVEATHNVFYSFEELKSGPTNRKKLARLAVAISDSRGDCRGCLSGEPAGERRGTYHAG